MAELHQCSDYDSEVVQYVHYEVRCMICWCLPPVRPGGGLTYLNITHLTSFRYQTVCNEILPMTAKLLFQSFVPLSLSLSSLSSVITGPGLSPVLFSIIFIDSVCIDTHQKDGEGQPGNFGLENYSPAVHLVI